MTKQKTTLSPKERQLKLRRAAEKLRVQFSGETFSSKAAAHDWMTEQAGVLEKQGWNPADIFHILKIVTEKFI